jgi:hypothetical protein
MGARPAVITDEILATMEAFMDEILKLGKELAAAGTDCKKATAAVKAATPAVTKAMAEAEKHRDAIEKDPAADAWTDQWADAKMKDVGDPFMAAATTCKDDKDFGEAMKALGLFKKKTQKPAPDDMKGSSAPPAPSK